MRHDRPSRPGARLPRAGRPRRRGRRSGAFGSAQPTAAATFSTSPTRSASSGLPPCRISSPGRQQVLRGAARAGRCPQRRATSSTCDLADPLQVRRAERAVASPRARCSCRRSAASTRNAAQRYGPGAASPPVAVDARPVVGVGAGVEPALDVAAEQAPVRSSPPCASAHFMSWRRDVTIDSRDAVLDPHRPPRLARERDRDRLHLRIRLRAEAAAEVRDDRRARSRAARSNSAGDLGAHEERVLAGRPERDLVAARPGRSPCASPSRTGRPPRSSGARSHWATCQHPFLVRAEIAALFELPLSSVRVIVPYLGGGFGSKSYTKMEPITVALARKARRVPDPEPRRRVDGDLRRHA